LFFPAAFIKTSLKVLLFYKKSPQLSSELGTLPSSLNIPFWGIQVNRQVSWLPDHPPLRLPRLKPSSGIMQVCSRSQWRDRSRIFTLIPYSPYEKAPVTNNTVFILILHKIFTFYKSLCFALQPPKIIKERACQ